VSRRRPDKTVWAFLALVGLASAAESSTRDDDRFRGVTVIGVRVDQGWVQVPPDNVWTFTKTWQAKAPDLTVPFAVRFQGEDFNEDQLRGRLWLRLDGREYRLLGILRAGGVPDVVVRRHTETVSLCDFSPVDWKYSDTGCSDAPRCWTLPKGEHKVQVCVKGATCSAPVTFQWPVARNPICP